MKKFTRLLSLLFFLQIVWSSSIYGQVYQNGFSTSINTPDIISPSVYSAIWTSSTGTVLALTPGELRANGFPSSSASLTLTVKVKCGYELDISSITFKHFRSTNDGPANLSVSIDGGAATNASTPVSPSFSTVTVNSGITQDVIGQTTITLNLTNITVPGSGDYNIDDFTINGTVTSRLLTLTSSIPSATVCEGTAANFTGTFAATGVTIPNPSVAAVTPAYQWEKNTVNAPGTSTNLNYSISPTVSPTDNGAYRLGVRFTGCAAGTPTEFYTTPDINLVVNKVTAAITPSSASVCVNSTTALTGTHPGTTSTILTEVWTTSNGNATVSTTGVVTGMSSGTSVITYTVTDDNMCSSSSSVTVTVNPLPTPSIASTETSGLSTNDATICNGATISLTASGGTGYAWSTGAVVAGITPSNTATATYTVTVTDGNGCSASTSQVVTVNPNPTPSVNASPSAIVCAGTAVTLTASGGTSYNWTSPVVNGNPFTPAATATYTVTVTDANSCSATTTQTVTVNPLPTISFTNTGTPPGEVCVGNTITINGGATGTTHAWSVTPGTGSASGASTTGSIVLTGTTAGTVTVVYTVTSGASCSTSSSMVVTVNGLPNNPTITGSLSICEGSTTILTGSTPSGGSGTGYFANFTGSGPANVTFTPGFSMGMYTATVESLLPPVSPSSTYLVGYSISDSKGCINAVAATATVTVYAKPSAASIIPDPMRPTTRCNTSTFTVTGNTPSVGSGTWTTTAGTITSASSTTTTITGITAGTTATATWTITNGSCGATSSNIASVILTNNVMPTITATPATQAACSTSSFNIFSTNNVGTGVWTTTAGTVTNTTSNSTSVTGIPTGTTATLTWTVTNGTCTASTTITVTNTAPPSAAVITTTPQKQCGAGVFVVNATAPVVGTGMWTVVGGVAQTPSSNTTFVTGVAPGTVATATWTVSSGPGCPSTSASVTLTNYQAPTGVNAGIDQSKCNDIFGTFSLSGSFTPLVGVTDLQYSWTATSGTFSSSTSTVTNITGVSTGSSATATFTVTNGVCTAASDQVVLNNYALPTATVTPNITVCNQTTDFAVTGTATPTTPTLGVYTYAWSVTGGTLTSSSTGTAITVTVAPGSSATASWTVTNGSCSTSSFMVITNNAGVTASILPAGNQTLCNTMSMGSFTVTGNTPSVGTGVWTVTGGTPSSTTNTSITVSSVNAGTTATATWTVTNGTCSSSATVTLTNVGAPTASITTPSSIKCNEAGPFTVQAAALTFGTGMWTVTNGTINGSSTGTSVSVSVTPGVSATTATVTWTVTNGMCGSTSSSITIENRPALTATIVPNPITPTEMCPLTSINLQATPNGGPGRVYALQSFVGGAGSGTDFIVNFNPDPNANPNRLATVNGINPRPIVTLTYTIIDNAGCTFSTQFVTKVNPPISVTVPATNVCVGNTAIVTPVITGGSGTYSTFSWTATGNATASGTASTFVVTGVTAGSANVVYSVVDNQTCPASGTATGVITVNPSPVLVNASQTNVSCFGGSNGAVTFTGATSYTIAPAVGTQGSAGVFTGLTAGTYTVVGTSGFGCTSSTSVTITQPTQVAATVTITTPVACNGGMATLLISGSGGTPGYIISGGTATPSVVAGTYTYTVTDVNGCSASTSITVGQPPVLTATISVTSNVSCNGGSDGISEVTAGGGTAPYSYLWSSGDVTRMTTSGLVAGTYTVTVTDANSCTASTTVIIGQPPVLVASITSQVNVTCNGGSTGSATAQAVGGTTAYSYSWNTSPVQTTATATGLAAGTYTVVVTDAQSCVASTTVTITQPTALLAGASQNTPPSRNGFGISCFGGSDGSATAAAFGGTMPYTYLWNNGETTVVATMLSAGLATVTVTDANGCMTTASVTMTQPPSAVSFSSATFTSPNCAVGQGTSNNGTITVSATGGISSYAYTITPTASQASSGVFTGLTAGTYTITVTDANSCTATRSVTVTALAVVAVTPSAVPPAICSGTATTLGASATGGTITGYSWSVTASTGNTATAVPATASTASFSSTISQGANTVGISTLTYTVVATNSSNCSASSSVNVVVNPLPFLTGVGSPDPTCRDAGAFGFIYLTNPNSANQINFVAPDVNNILSPSLPTVALTASPVRVDVIPTLPIGNSTLNYTVTNTTTGCVSPSSSYVVRVNTLPTVTLLSISGANDICDGGPTKTLDVTTNGANVTQVGAFPRTVRVRKTVNSVVSTFDIIVAAPVSGSVASGSAVITEAGTYEVIGITDGATCAGTVTGIFGGPIRTLSDGRFTVTAPASNTTQIVYNGCNAVLTAAASFNSTPSVGTLAYQWEVDPGTGYIAVNGETNPTLTLTGINSTFNGLKYRVVVTGTGSSCGTVIKFSNVITLSVAAFPTTNAGPDQTAPGLTFTLAASTPPSGTTGAWTVVSTNTTVTFANSASPTTTVTLADPGTTATLRWTITAPGGCSASDEVIITRAGIRLNATAFLEGPMNGTGTAMATTLATNSLIPLSFNGESVSSATVFTANSIVDWVTVQIRISGVPGGNTLLSSRSALLKSNGQIVDLDGTSALSFPTIGTGTYNVAVLHRNHVAMRTSTGIAFTANTTTSFNFTSGAVIGGKTKLGKRVLIAGDANNSQHVTAGDVAIYNTQSSLSGYRSADFNLSGVVTVGDLIFINLNTGGAPIFNLNQ